MSTRWNYRDKSSSDSDSSERSIGSDGRIRRKTKGRSNRRKKNKNVSIDDLVDSWNDMSISGDDGASLLLGFMNTAENDKTLEYGVQQYNPSLTSSPISTNVLQSKTPTISPNNTGEIDKIDSMIFNICSTMYYLPHHCISLFKKQNKDKDRKKYNEIVQLVLKQLQNIIWAIKKLLDATKYIANNKMLIVALFIILYNIPIIRPLVQFVLYLLGKLAYYAMEKTGLNAQLIQFIAFVKEKTTEFVQLFLIQHLLPSAQKAFITSVDKILSSNPVQNTIINSMKSAITADQTQLTIQNTMTRAIENANVQKALSVVTASTIAPLMKRQFHTLQLEMHSLTDSIRGQVTAQFNHVDEKYQKIFDANLSVLNNINSQGIDTNMQLVQLNKRMDAQLQNDNWYKIANALPGITNVAKTGIDILLGQTIGPNERVQHLLRGGRTRRRIRK